MKTIWYVTGIVVAICAAVVGIRGYRQWTSAAPTRFVQDDAVRALLTLLAEDPQARRARTRALVETVAAPALRDGAPKAESYFALGLLRHGQGNNAEAEAAFRRAVDLAPSWSWPYNSLGIVLSGSGRTAEAETLFHKAAVLDPTWSRPHNDLAVLYRTLGRLEEARREALRALELAPEGVASHNNYGNLLVALGNPAEARAEYEKAIAAAPDHPSPYYNLACLNSREDRKDEALQYLKKAIELDASFAAEARRDADLSPLRDDPAFRALVAQQ